MPKKILAVTLLIITLFINGCWDRRELESLGLVQALGLDQGPGGKGLTITTMIAIPPKLGAGGGQSGGGGGAETGVFTISMNAPTIYEAFNRLNTTINREITLMQNSTILISEELAKSGIGKWTDTFVRFREMRRTVLLFITKGKAADIMKVQPKLEKNPSEYFIDLTKLSNVNGMFPLTTVNDFITCFETYAQEIYIPFLTKYQPVEPGPAKKTDTNDATGSPPGGGNKDSGPDSSPKTENIRIIGTAVFKGDKMVGSLDNYESQVFMLLTGRFHEAMLTLLDPHSPDEYIAFRLFQAKKPAIKYTHRENIDSIRVKLNLEADILSIQSLENYTIPSKEKLLAGLIARSLKKRIEKVITKVQQQYQSDIFGFGVKVRSTIITSTSWNEYHWPERFPSSKINVSVKVYLRRVGVQFQPPHLK